MTLSCSGLLFLFVSGFACNAIHFTFNDGRSLDIESTDLLEDPVHGGLGFGSNAISLNQDRVLRRNCDGNCGANQFCCGGQFCATVGQHQCCNGTYRCPVNGDCCGSGSCCPAGRDCVQNQQNRIFRCRRRDGAGNESLEIPVLTATLTTTSTSAGSAVATLTTTTTRSCLNPRATACANARFCCPQSFHCYYNRHLRPRCHFKSLFTFRYRYSYVPSTTNGPTIYYVTSTIYNLTEQTTTVPTLTVPPIPVITASPPVRAVSIPAASIVDDDLDTGTPMTGEITATASGTAVALIDGGSDASAGSSSLIGTGSASSTTGGAGRTVSVGLRKSSTGGWVPLAAGATLVGFVFGFAVLA